MPDLSVFFRDDNQILHSYSTYFVGLDIFLPMYHLLDVTPLDRQENGNNSMTAERGRGSDTTTHTAIKRIAETPVATAKP